MTYSAADVERADCESAKKVDECRGSGHQVHVKQVNSLQTCLFEVSLHLVILKHAAFF